MELFGHSPSLSVRRGEERLPEYQACLCMAIIMSCILAMLLDVFLHDAEDVDVKCT